MDNVPYDSRGTPDVSVPTVSGLHIKSIFGRNVQSVTSGTIGPAVSVTGHQTNVAKCKSEGWCLVNVCMRRFLSSFLCNG